MKEYQGLKFTEIAETLKVPINTVKSRMYYDLSALKKIFDRWHISEDIDRGLQILYNTQETRYDHILQQMISVKKQLFLYDDAVEVKEIAHVYSFIKKESHPEYRMGFFL